MTSKVADPQLFAWSMQNYGPEVGFFVNQGQIVPLECQGSGTWGTASLWGRVQSYTG